MNTNICTSIEQSKKLLELGLPKDTADMYWMEWKRMTKLIRIPHVGKASKDDLPAWSLGALLELMPTGMKYETRIDLVYNSFSLVAVDDEVIVPEKYSHGAPTLIEAAFNYVVWLLQNNYIKTEKV